MEFGVLGPLQVNGGSVIPSAKQRILLAVLLLHANRVVPVEALVDAVWDDAPPPSARVTLQGYVKQLRQNLGAQAGRRIVTRSPGYLMEVAAGELDLDRFTALCGQAQSAADQGDWPQAARLFGEALALWRGDPLADVPAAAVQRTEVPRLAELRMQAVESRVEADLRLGRHRELVAELWQLAGGESLREGLHGQLMLALYGCGRQAEALEVFRGIDRRLRDELGISPGPGLQQLHQRILAADPALSDGQLPCVAKPPRHGSGPSAAPRPGVTSRPVVLAQLPPDTPDFTGRVEQVKLLHDLLVAPLAPERPGAVVISVVAGMAGVGKTALGVHVAHRVRDRFPDGQLYVSLQGATKPLRPAAVLARLLRDLGGPDEAIPVAEEERTARYRSLLAGRRMLIMLDDAADAAQVRSLLPGSAGCAVVITSRGTLTGLAGAAQLSLDVLEMREARDLFDAIVGVPRAAAEPQATSEVLACCAGLPLAVRVAASRLVSRPAWSVAHLAAKLADERSRLAELSAGDVAVRASFAVSYDALAGDGAGGPSGPGSAGPARVFRLLGLPDMAELSLQAIAALAGQQAEQVAPALETLTDAHLLESPEPDRYQLHDLLRSYAAELAGQSDSTEERATAMRRLLDWYAATAAVAARVMHPSRRFPGDAGAGMASDAVRTPELALGWFESERVNLVSATVSAAELGQHAAAARIAAATWVFFQRKAFHDDWLTTHHVGVASARRTGDDALLSWLLNGLGQVRGRMGDFAVARRALIEALAIRRRLGDRAGEAAALNSLGALEAADGHLAEGLGYLRQAHAIHVATGNAADIGIALNNIGDVLLRLGRHDEALRALDESLSFRRAAGSRYGEGVTESTIGQVYVDLGRHEEAIRHFRLALAAGDADGGPARHRADVLYQLGSSLRSLGRRHDAQQTWRAALPEFERSGDPRTAELHRELGEAK